MPIGSAVAACLCSARSDLSAYIAALASSWCCRLLPRSQRLCCSNGCHSKLIVKGKCNAFAIWTPQPNTGDGCGIIGFFCNCLCSYCPPHADSEIYDFCRVVEPLRGAGLCTHSIIRLRRRHAARNLYFLVRYLSFGRNRELY